MSDVHLSYVNEVYCRVESDMGITMELSDTLTWKAENYRFHPKYKCGMWDGNISLVNKGTRLVYIGLLDRIRQFCEERDYSFSYDEKLNPIAISDETLNRFIEWVDLPKELEVREYQFETIKQCIQNKRLTVLSATGSGKSLSIYLTGLWYIENHKQKVLVIVPTISLVSQLQSDLRDYGFGGKIETSINGLSKSDNIDTDFCITTWQSLSNGKTSMHKSWYNQFGVIIGDEAHQAKSTMLVKILSSMTNTPHRFGFTGTLSDDELNVATIEGLFGKQFNAISAKEMIQLSFSTPIKIKCLVLKYPEEVCKEFHKGVYDPKSGKIKKKSYQDEVNFLLKYEARNKFIKNLVKSLDGNKIVFFRFEEHGKELYAMMEKGSDNIFYIDGKISVDIREQIRHAIEEEENCTLLGSLGTVSTGSNFKKLKHMVAAHPSKSKIKVLQSIGRMLRLHPSKSEVYLYDIVDDLSYKSKRNYLLDHFLERVKIYTKEGFPFKVYKTKV
jgi:superfamily II DNA or RNA helicase